MWNTIKGFFNKGGEEAAAESGKTVETFFEKLSSKVQTSGNGLIEKVGGVWKAIKAGAHETFSGSGGGIVSTVIDGFKAIGGAVSKSKVGSALIKGAGKLVAGAGGLIKGAVGAIGAAGASAIPVVGAVAATAGLAIYGTAKNYKHQKEIWSNKEDGFGKKAIKSVATFIWDTSPIGAVVNLCKDIFGKSKETAENTKDTANSSSETAENTKKATGVTNLTEYKVGTFSFDNSQTQYNELLFFFRGLFKNGKVDDSQEGTITHVEQVPTGNTDSYGNPEYETKTIIDSKIRIETYYTSTNTMVVPLITNSTIWYHTFFSYPSAYFVRQWEHYKADPSQNIIQGTYKEGMSFNTDVVDNMDYQWCNSNIMRYFSVSVSQNNTVTVTFKNAFRYTTKKGFWDDSGKVSIYPNYAIPRIIYGIK